MASRHLSKVAGAERVKTKHYFYILRPLLAVEWIERGYGVAPTAFNELLERLVDDPDLKATIQRMILEKSLETEKDARPAEPLIDSVYRAGDGALEGSPGPVRAAQRFRPTSWTRFSGTRCAKCGAGAERIPEGVDHGL